MLIKGWLGVNLGIAAWRSLSHPPPPRVANNGGIFTAIEYEFLRRCDHCQNVTSGIYSVFLRRWWRWWRVTKQVPSGNAFSSGPGAITYIIRLSKVHTQEISISLRFCFIILLKIRNCDLGLFGAMVARVSPRWVRRLKRQGWGFESPDRW